MTTGKHGSTTKRQFGSNPMKTTDIDIKRVSHISPTHITLFDGQIFWRKRHYITSSTK
jgi:hypothetical protein